MTKFAATRRLALTFSLINRRLRDNLSDEQFDCQLTRYESALAAARRDGVGYDAQARLIIRAQDAVAKARRMRGARG